MADHTFPALHLVELATLAGFKLTAAGRTNLAHSTAGQIAKVEEALDQGVTFDQLETAKWDGEPWFEQVAR